MYLKNDETNFKRSQNTLQKQILIRTPGSNYLFKHTECLTRTKIFVDNFDNNENILAKYSNELPCFLSKVPVL